MNAGASAHITIDRRDVARYPIPVALNVTLVSIQTTTALAILWAASRVTNATGLALLALAFALVMQFGFCLAHEAVHGKLHPRHAANEALGVAMFALFPGSYEFFRVAHLIHHQRNRSDAELEDYVLPGESPWLKRLNYYLLIDGLFWLLVPLSSIACALWPSTAIRLPAADAGAGQARKFVQFVNKLRLATVRRDVLVTIVAWAILVPVLGLELRALALCYAAFAFSWASQQYVYHVRTPRHAILGALDLRIWRPLELLYLYFNYHQTHHRAVWIPWIHLPRVAAGKPTRGYLVTYLDLWRPPQPIAQAWPPRFQATGPLAPRPAGVGVQERSS